MIKQFLATSAIRISLKGMVIAVCLLILLLPSTWAQKTTLEFAHYPDGTILKMDFYQQDTKMGKPSAVILLVFGGGFFTGSRSDTVYQTYIHFLVNKGFDVAVIDYRLGLKGNKKAPSLFNRKPLINAIALAVADTYSATN